MKNEISIVWFRQDLRLSDNPALFEAAQFQQTLPIYIFDDCALNEFKIGAASKVWLHHSLNSLNDALDGKLNIFIGTASTVMQSLIEQYEIHTIFCNACYEPWHIKQENDVKSLCGKKNINYKIFNSSCLWNAQEILKDDEAYYKVFTPYKKRAHQYNPRKAIEKPTKINAIKNLQNKLTISSLNLIPKNTTWHTKITKSWHIGELAAQNKLFEFIKTKLAGYKYCRDFPMKNQTSLLSPHLHFGEISPAQVWQSVKKLGFQYANEKDIEHFLSEVTWREFSYYLLHHFPTLHKNNFNDKFNKFPWKNNAQYLKAWQTGNTGYPIVDAGMRQLWQTGYMHNRTRMVTASFLVKNLNIHWHKGRDWFWNCLVDADLANNSAGWQWVAGSGVDAAPYFRIFNPYSQTDKFDKDKKYIKKWVPEFETEKYPEPMVEHKFARERCLSTYKEALN